MTTSRPQNQAINPDQLRSPFARAAWAAFAGTYPDDLLPIEAASRVLDLSRATLATYRSRGKGPLWLRWGRTIRYPLADIIRYIEANTLTGGNNP